MAKRSGTAEGARITVDSQERNKAHGVTRWRPSAVTVRPPLVVFALAVCVASVHWRGPIFPWEQVTLTRALVVLVGLWTAMRWVRGRVRMESWSLGLISPSALFAIVAFSSLLWTRDFSLGISRFVGLSGSLLLVLCMVLLIERRSELMVVLQGFVLGGLIPIVGVLLAWQAGHGFRRYVMLEGQSLNQTAFGVVLTIGVAIYLLIESRSRWARVFNAIYVPLASFGVVLSGSRGSLVPLLVLLLGASAYVLFGARRNRRPQLVLIGVTLVSSWVARLVPEPVQQRLLTLTDVDAVYGLEGRLFRWGEAWEYLGYRAFGGLGIGGAGVGATPHNTHLNVWLELGVLGLVSWIAIWAMLLYTLTKYCRDGERILWVLIVVALLAGLLSRDWITGHPVWLVYGAGVSLSALARRAEFTRHAAREFIAAD